MSNRRRPPRRIRNADQWEKVGPTVVPPNVHEVVALVLLAAEAQGCTCDPEVRVPQDPDALVHTAVAHEDHCGIWTAGKAPKSTEGLS